MNKHKENIFALATPPGKSAIAIIRISGIDSFNIVNKISTNMPKAPNKAALNRIELNKKNIIDQTITTYFKVQGSCFQLGNFLHKLPEGQCMNTSHNAIVVATII